MGWAKYILPDEAFDTLAEALGAVSITRYPGDRANHIVHHEGFIWRESDLPDRNPYAESCCE